MQGQRNIKTALEVEVVETGRNVLMFRRKYLLVTYPNDVAVNSSGSIKCGEIPEVLLVGQPMKKESAPWS